MNSSAVLTSVRRLRSQMAAHLGQEQSDAQLLATYSNRHDEAAFTTLVRWHGPMVIGDTLNLVKRERGKKAEIFRQARKARKARKATHPLPSLFGRKEGAFNRTETASERIDRNMNILAFFTWLIEQKTLVAGLGLFGLAFYHCTVQQYSPAWQYFLSLSKSERTIRRMADCQEDAKSVQAYLRRFPPKN